MNNTEIVYAISTGDCAKEEKMKLLTLHISGIKRQERIRISNLILSQKDEELEQSQSLPEKTEDALGREK